MIDREIDLEVPETVIQNWQEIVDILAEIGGIPAALIMRLRDPDIEVLVSSRSTGNPYQHGDREALWGSGLYCETVIQTKQRLIVPNALADDDWKKNPDVERRMISYLGFPILLPNQKPFGTICVLDNKDNSYTEKFQKLMSKFRDLVQADLEIVYMNQILGDKNKRLSDYLMELQALRGLVSICANCKSIRDDQGKWHPIEDYLIRHPEADFSHDICPKCLKELYPDLDKNV